MSDEKLKKRKQIGANLRVMRFSANMLQSKAASMVGITQPQLSMIENGKRSISAELQQQLIEIYSSKMIQKQSNGTDDVNSTNENNIALETVKLLQRLAEKTNSEEMVYAVDYYICVCTYIFLRKLYLVNPHNTEKAFSVPCGTFESLVELIGDEPDKAVSFAKASKSVSCSKIEPNESELSEFFYRLLECEKFIALFDKK